MGLVANDWYVASAPFTDAQGVTVGEVTHPLSPLSRNVKRLNRVKAIHSDKPSTLRSPQLTSLENP